MKTINQKKILIATFSIRQKGKRTAINGMIEPMLSYFLPKNQEIDLIDGFHPGSSDVISIIESYKTRKLITAKKSFISLILYPLLLLQNKNSTQIIFKLRDLLAVLEWGTIRAQKKYDLFIGLECIYTLSGIILKRLGIVKTVIYYVSDYAPNRYTQKQFNNLYLWLDQFCARYADFIWDVSPAMHPARIKTGLDPKKSAPVILVPNALFPKQIAPKPIYQTDDFSLVYAGTLTKSNGPDLAISAMPLILKRFPKTTLHIYGSNGADQARIKELINKYQLEKQVIFHGFITDVVDITNAINKYRIGMAPYLDIPGSHRKYGDATKLRLYLGAGLPIITTSVPPLGKQISDAGAALTIQDNDKELAKAVVKLFSNEELYKIMKNKAILLAKNNTWETTYGNAIEQMNLKNFI